MTRAKFYGGPYDGKTLDVRDEPVQRVLAQSGPIYFVPPPKRPRFPWLRPWRVLAFLRARARYRVELEEFNATAAEPVPVETHVYRREVWTHAATIREFMEAERRAEEEGKPLGYVRGPREVFYVHESLGPEALLRINPCTRGDCRCRR